MILALFFDRLSGAGSSRGLSSDVGIEKRVGRFLGQLRTSDVFGGDYGEYAAVRGCGFAAREAGRRALEEFPNE